MKPPRWVGRTNTQALDQGTWSLVTLGVSGVRLFIICSDLVLACVFSVLRVVRTTLVLLLVQCG